MSEYVSAFDRCLDRSLPKGQQPRGEWMRADHDRIRDLEAVVKVLKAQRDEGREMARRCYAHASTYRAALERIEALGSGEAVRIARAALESSDD